MYRVGLRGGSCIPKRPGVSTDAVAGNKGGEIREDDGIAGIAVFKVCSQWNSNILAERQQAESGIRRSLWNRITQRNSVDSGQRIRMLCINERSGIDVAVGVTKEPATQGNRTRGNRCKVNNVAVRGLVG